MILSRTKSLACFAAMAVMGVAATEGDGWKPADLIQPEALAQILRQGNLHPLLIYVGFERLYAATRLPGARFGGPASTPAGLALLRNLLSAIPRDRQVIVYCGCCPWDHCPNIRPAFALLREMKFRDAKAVYIPTNMHTDWIEKGYPVERP